MGGREYLHHMVLLLARESIHLLCGTWSGTPHKQGLFQCEEGEQHGAVESIPLFTLGTDTANNQSMKKIDSSEGRWCQE